MRLSLSLSLPLSLSLSLSLSHSLSLVLSLSRSLALVLSLMVISEPQIFAFRTNVHQWNVVINLDCADMELGCQKGMKMSSTQLRP